MATRTSALSGGNRTVTGLAALERWRPLTHLGLAALTALPLACSQAQAQVPADIEARLQQIGPIVDPACTAELYRPLMPAQDITSSATPLYPGIRIARNQSFGSQPKDVVDVFWAATGRPSRPVLIYVPGGAGNKIEIQNRAANAFYDNIGRWATEHGMVGVLMQRHASPGWDGGARSISQMIQWLQSNIARYRGDAARMIIWAHSAGNGPLGTYVGRPELYGPRGVGVLGAIFMSGQFDIAPVEVPAAGGPALQQLAARAGVNCGQPGPRGTAGALPGAAPGTPGGPDEATAPAPPPTPPNRATLLAHSSLPALERTSIRIMLGNSEFDPGIDGTQNGGLSPFNRALADALCHAGPDRCPTLLVAKGESHISAVFSIDTADQNVSGPVLRFIHATLAEGGRTAATARP